MKSSPSLPKNIDSATDTTMCVLELFGLTHDDVHEAIIESRIDTSETHLFSSRLLIKQCFNQEPNTSEKQFTAHPTEVIYEILINSKRGIKSDTKYWNDVPQYDLCDTLCDYGYKIEFQDSDGDNYTDFFSQNTNLEFDIVLVNDKYNHQIGQTRTSFTYPNTELKQNNYPSLIHHINKNHLHHRDVSYVLLKPREDKWAFALIEKERLKILTEKYGDKITIYGEPLLAAPSLNQYTSPPVPDHTIDNPLLGQEQHDIGEELTDTVGNNLFKSPTQLVSKIINNSETTHDDTDNKQIESQETPSEKTEPQTTETDTTENDETETKSLTQRIISFFK